MASTTFDLPDPFGPTTAVIPGSKLSVVDEANDLKPRMVRLLRYTQVFLIGPAGNLAMCDFQFTASPWQTLVTAGT